MIDRMFLACALFLIYMRLWNICFEIKRLATALEKQNRETDQCELNEARELLLRACYGGNLGMSLKPGADWVKRRIEWLERNKEAE